MSYTNVYIEDRSSDRKRLALLEAELSFWRSLAEELQLKFENIPQAVQRYGYVELIDGPNRITLIEKPESDQEPSP